MQVAQYIFDQLARWGTEMVFMITGGGAMFLNAAAGREKRIRYIPCLHEQACAIAAEGYARIARKPGVVCVTSGPGGTNAITGVTGAWLDSIPMIVISGQVKRETMTSRCPELKLRQLGDQELNIVDLVRPVTKYAAVVDSKESIRFHLEKAWKLAQSGRPGPVWLDIPLDIQAADIEPDQLPGFNENTPVPAPAPEAMAMAIQMLKQAERPVIVAGWGVHASNCENELQTLAEKFHIPILLTPSGIDLVPSEHPLNFGRPGVIGNRAANFIMQNADLLLVIGTRMNLRVIGYNFAAIARNAKRIMVDIDPDELRKPTFHVDLPICADAKIFISELIKSNINPDTGEFLNYCRSVYSRYPAITAEQRAEKKYVSSYLLPELIAGNIKTPAIVVTGNGTAYTSTFQSIPVKKDMRVFANVGCASMGYGLPAAIGAKLAAPDSEVILITGDGSIQMNIQELQTIINLKLPIKIFVYNNDGYLSIKLTQKNFNSGVMVGADSSSGVILPNLEKIAAAYGFAFFRLSNNREAEEQISRILAQPGPVIIEVMTDPMENLQPKAASKRLPDGSLYSAPLEDMAPFLDREEFMQNMLIEPYDEVQQ